MQRYNKYKKNLERALCLVSTLISGWVSAFGQPYGPCPQADTQPDTWVDTRPRTPFSVGLIYVFPSRYCGAGRGPHHFRPLCLIYVLPSSLQTTLSYICVTLITSDLFVLYMCYPAGTVVSYICVTQQVLWCLIYVLPSRYCGVLYMCYPAGTAVSYICVTQQVLWCLIYVLPSRYCGVLYMSYPAGTVVSYICVTRQVLWCLIYVLPSRYCGVLYMCYPAGTVVSYICVTRQVLWCRPTDHAHHITPLCNHHSPQHGDWHQPTI